MGASEINVLFPRGFDGVLGSKTLTYFYGVLITIYLFNKKHACPYDLFAIENSNVITIGELAPLAIARGAILTGMWSRHARSGMPHLGWHRARFCDVQGSHLHGKMAGDPWKRAGRARAR